MDIKEEILDIAKRIYHNHLTAEYGAKLIYMKVLSLTAPEEDKEEGFFCNLKPYRQSQKSCEIQCRACAITEKHQD